MPNIISGRCPRTEGRRRTLLQRPLLSKAGTLSEPSSVTSEDICHEELLQKDRDWLLRCMQGNHPKFLTKAELRTARALASPRRRLCSRAPTRRLNDGLRPSFAAPHMSANGTNRPWRHSSSMSAVEGKPAVPSRCRDFSV